MIKKITWPELINLLLNANNRIVLAVPAIHDEWVQVISENKKLNEISIKVCIDNSELVLRNGYGSIESIDHLKRINADIRECNGLRINFVCIDNLAFCLFLESRILVGDPFGFNAIQLDLDVTEKIINELFPLESEKLNSLDLEIITTPLIEIKLEEIRISIEKNPPEEPDLKRKISTYNTLFQYAELHFEGSNLFNKTISIPPDALPFKDAELKERMKTRFNLFTKDITKNWNELIELKNKVEDVRKEFLVPCSVRKEKSILKKENKVAFQKAVSELQVLAEENVKVLKNKVQTAINNSEDTLRNELSIFFKSNPPDSISGLDKENADRQINKEITKILGRIKVPDADSLVSKMKLDVMYYELTWEDLNDKKFIEWFVKNDLISKDDEQKLANFSNAFSIKR
jgi:hypothetical protein